MAEAGQVVGAVPDGVQRLLVPVPEPGELHILLSALQDEDAEVRAAGLLPTLGIFGVVIMYFVTNLALVTQFFAGEHLLRNAP